MKFTKEQKTIIKQFRNSIQKLEKEQTAEYKKLCKQLNLKIGTSMEEYLFDYVYNGFGDIALIENAGQIKFEESKDESNY